ncbi:MAG: MerR family transcriptional regulator [Candidatus Fimimonas sp.]
MYSMKKTCEIVNLSYQTLKFYCNEGLIPNVKRDCNNYRVFDDNDIEWIKGLMCLKNCGMSLKEMKDYMQLCLLGESSIPDRKKMLDKTKEELQRKLFVINDSLSYIDKKQKFYDDVLEGKTPYFSNLTKK